MYIIFLQKRKKQSDKRNGIEMKIKKQGYAYLNILKFLCISLSKKVKVYFRL